MEDVDVWRQFYFVCVHGSTAHSGPKPPHYRGFEIILRHTTLGRTPLYEWSARRRDLYLTTHNTHKKQTSTPLTGFEPAITADELPQTHALDRAAAGFGILVIHHHHHQHQGLDPLIRSVSRVTTAPANVSSVFQLFSFLVVCSCTILKGFGFCDILCKCRRQFHPYSSIYLSY
jgi:hypothetical protein